MKKWEELHSIDEVEIKENLKSVIRMLSKEDIDIANL